MSKEEIHSYRLNSLEEPTDGMLEYVMSQVQETAKISTRNADEELKRRFEEMCLRIARRKIEEV